MKCPKCGYAKNEEGTKLCNLCGEVLAKTKPDQTSAQSAASTVSSPSATGAMPAVPAAPEGTSGDMTGAGIVAPAAPVPPPPQGGFCYLHCSLLSRPLRLNPVRQINVGRGPDNDIVIPSQMVSRRHGQFNFENGVWAYTDLKSSNGSKVNTKRVERAILSTGDVIDLGGFLITYREIHDLEDLAPDTGAVETHGDSKTVSIDLNTLRKAGVDGITLLSGISGSLGDMALPDLLQLMEMQRKTGTLNLDFDGAVGKVFIVAGNMIHAEYGKFTGESAVFKMVPKSKGNFRFDPREPKVATTIRRPTTSVLLDASREIDENAK